MQELSTDQTEMFKDKLVGKLKIPDNIYELKHSAFSKTDGITEVILPTGFKISRTSAFADCTNLKKVLSLLQSNNLRITSFLVALAFIPLYYLPKN